MMMAKNCAVYLKLCRGCKRFLSLPLDDLISHIRWRRVGNTRNNVIILGEVVSTYVCV